MKNITTVSTTVSNAAGTVLDFIMNDESIQEQMRTWIEATYPNLNQSEAVQEANEGTIEESMYYAATVEYHNRVLSYAALHLLND